MGAAPIRTYLRQVYLPSALVRASEGVLVATLPLYLLDAGLSATRSSVVLAAFGFGAAVSILPMGVLLSRHAVRDVLRWVGAATVVALALLGVVPVTVAALVPLRMVAGLGQLSWIKGQETYLFRRLDPRARGVGLATLAATNRAAFLVGPVVGGLVARWASFEAAFALAAACCALGTTGLLLAPEVPAVRLERGLTEGPPRLRDVVAEHRRALLLLGTASMCVGALRLGYLTLVAFRGEQLGLRAGAIGLVVSVTFALDLALFPVAGRIIDHHGRLHAIVPAFTTLAVATGLIWAAGSLTQLLVLGVVAGIGNGLSNGTMLTLSSDLAPPAAPGQFLAGVGFLAAVGDLLGPLLVGVLTDAANLTTASIVVAVVGMGVVAVSVLGIGETRGLAHAD